jgi:hypothetical protein
VSSGSRRYPLWRKPANVDRWSGQFALLRIQVFRKLAKHMSPEGDGAENTPADSHEQITLFYAVLHENVAFYGLKNFFIIV